MDFRTGWVCTIGQLQNLEEVFALPGAQIVIFKYSDFQNVKSHGGIGPARPVGQPRAFRFSNFPNFLFENTRGRTGTPGATESLEWGRAVVPTQRVPAGLAEATAWGAGERHGPGAGGTGR